MSGDFERWEGWSHVSEHVEEVPVGVKGRAVRMVGEIRADHESEWAAMAKVSELLGVGTPETVRKWVRQPEVDAGRRPGVTSEDSAEVKRLKRENAELKRANGILKAAAAFFGAELDRPFRLLWSSSECTLADASRVGCDGELSRSVPC